MRSSDAETPALLRNFAFACVIFTLLTDGNAQSDSSTHPPINRGAARQMYGSGSLRQTGSLKIVAGTTDLPLRHNKDKEEPKNALGHKQDYSSKSSKHEVNKNRDGVVSEHPYESLGRFGYGGYGTSGRQKVHSLPPDFYGHSHLPEEGSDDDADDAPSYRNGAPVNGIRLQPGSGSNYGQGRYGNNERGIDGGFIRGSLYGSSDTGLDESDRSRIRTEIERGHGFSQHSETNNRFGIDRKTLVQELEDEDESKLDGPMLCDPICANDQFLCRSTCTCIPFENRCDGNMDCENADDELNCESFEGHHFNDTCHSKRSVRCSTSGKCIAKEWLCDGDDDCGDFSDESHCGPQRNCTVDQFECRNGLCMPQNWICDGENDCKDFSDEENCNKKKLCYDNDFVCLDGTCIWDYLRCNGQKDCADGSDELKCEVIDVQCKEHQFQCAYPRCISLLFRCDGDDDCGDGSDEENCPTATDTSCNINEFRCASGNCINKKWVCDKEIECRDGDDERDCQYPMPENCSSKEEFTCSPGVCIPRSWACDGVPDCSNGEDEEGCQIGCELTQYLCRFNTNETKSGDLISNWYIHGRDPHHNCISMKYVCDGEPDCPEKDDEVYKSSY